MLATAVADLHPGLAFLAQAPEFKQRYIETAVEWILFDADRSWRDELTVPALRRCALLEVLAEMDLEPDINRARWSRTSPAAGGRRRLNPLRRMYFSYEHFYVIYTTFWKLDADRDLAITPEQLGLHDDSGLSEVVRDRVFAHTVLRGDAAGSGDATMGYRDWVRFLLAEEGKVGVVCARPAAHAPPTALLRAKDHPRAIEYWFRVLDLDGDGFITADEIDALFAVQASPPSKQPAASQPTPRPPQSARLHAMQTDSMKPADVRIQLIDMVRPAPAEPARHHSLPTLAPASHRHTRRIRVAVSHCGTSSGAATPSSSSTPWPVWRLHPPVHA